jgi:hypothetical protein
VSPKKISAIPQHRPRQGLLRQRASVAEAAYDAGLSGTGRLHDLFVTLEGMTPRRVSPRRPALAIQFSFGESPFGTYLVASTAKGVCKLAFVDDEASALADLRREWPNAGYCGRRRRPTAKWPGFSPATSRPPTGCTAPQGHAVSTQNLGIAAAHSRKASCAPTRNWPQPQRATRPCGRRHGHRRQPGGLPHPLPPRDSANRRAGASTAGALRAKQRCWAGRRPAWRQKPL